jgi:dihydropteroate synthase
MNTLNVGGRLLDLSHPIVMGILNITDDSFFDGGQYIDFDMSIAQAQKMIQEGAHIIDIGAASSRPCAPQIDPDIEIKRLLPVIKEINMQFPDIILSVDTFHRSVLESLSNEAAFIVNDITCGAADDGFQEAVASLGFPYVAMHMKGTPQNMQDNPQYNDVVKDILDYLVTQVRSIRSKGIDQLIVDPGFGFGKSIQHNYELLKHLNVFQLLECPIMVGLSRKSMIYKVLSTSADESINGTTALHMVALSKGAKVLRAHDVKAAVETITLWKQLK